MCISIETVRTDTFEMNYFRFGTGGKPMVMIPGISIKSVMESAEFVAGAYHIFSENYTVYVFDRRSELPETYTVDEMAEDTAAAIDRLGLSRTYIVGVSQGGCIAQIIAAKHPELVKTLALESTVSRLTPQSEQVVQRWVDLAKSGDKEALNMAFAEDIYSDSFREKYMDAILTMAKLYTDSELARFVTLAEGMRGFTIYDELDKVQCPVLVIGGSEDRIFDMSCFRDTAEKLHGELFIFEGYGHACYDETPEAKQKIFDFFEKN